MGLIGDGALSDAANKLLGNSDAENTADRDLSEQKNLATESILGLTDGIGGTAIPLKGADSIFNPFQIFRYSKFATGATAGNTGDYDVSKHRLQYDSSKLINAAKYEAKKLENKALEEIQNPSALTIIDWANRKAEAKSGPTYPYPYALNDFLWCKWYGKIPNNRLLTLRRYTIPVEDNLQIHQEKLPLVPIAQAVTWFGDGTNNSLSDILGMTYGFKWKPANANVTDVTGNELTVDNLIAAVGVKNEKAQQALKLAFGKMDENNPYSFSGYDKTIQEFTKQNWESGAYWNRVKGPINVINTTQMMDQGYDFTHSITLNFEYNLRSYGNINPKVAMLDLISNILSLTSNTADFWGGSSRYSQQTGALLPGFNTTSMEKGDYPQALKDISAMVGNMVADGGSDLKKFMDQLGNDMSSADDVKKAAEGIATTISQSDVGKKFLASRMASLHQKPLLMRALLDGRAVGEWHLMVGNPMDPIAVIGNLCLKRTKLTFSDELGANDFPVSVKFTIELEPGRPRAKQDIASMFNHGGGDLNHTPLQVPSSAMNSFGEYNSVRLASAHKTSTGSDADKDGKFKAFKDDLMKSKVEIDGTDGAIDAANYASYFGISVAARYGTGFGKSPILKDYFTKLQTKD